MGVVRVCEKTTIEIMYQRGAMFCQQLTKDGVSQTDMESFMKSYSHGKFYFQQKITALYSFIINTHTQIVELKEPKIPSSSIWTN